MPNETTWAQVLEEGFQVDRSAKAEKGSGRRAFSMAEYIGRPAGVSCAPLERAQQERAPSKRTPVAWRRIVAGDLVPATVIAPADFARVPQLAHGLDRALFSPGVHFMRCPRTHRSNFGGRALEPNALDGFDHETLPAFVPPSQDGELLARARAGGFAFAGSTSSLKGALIKCYLALTNDRPVDTSYLSHGTASHAYFQRTTMTQGTRLPSLVRVEQRDGVYAVDQHKPPTAPGEGNVLSARGGAVELLLTLSDEALSRHMSAHTASLDDAGRVAVQRSVANVYHTGAFGNIAVRSQIDCSHPLLPRCAFDIKSRAVFPVRLDPQQHGDYAAYRLDRLRGVNGSFEREYHDMARSIMLGYALQARMGAMDGVFVAYHNVRELFGFQYLPLEEMDRVVFGSSRAGELVTRACFQLLSDILLLATKSVEAAAAGNPQGPTAFTLALTAFPASERSGGRSRLVAHVASADGSQVISKISLELCSSVNGRADPDDAASPEWACDIGTSIEDVAQCTSARAAQLQREFIGIASGAVAGSSKDGGAQSAAALRRRAVSQEAMREYRAERADETFGVSKVGGNLAAAARPTSGLGCSSARGKAATAVGQGARKCHATMPTQPSPNEAEADEAVLISEQALSSLLRTSDPFAPLRLDNAELMRPFGFVTAAQKRRSGI